MVVFNFSASAMDAAPAPPMRLSETHDDNVHRTLQTTAHNTPARHSQFRSTRMIVVFNFSASAMDAAPAPPMPLAETHDR